MTGALLAGALLTTTACSSGPQTSLDTAEPSASPTTSASPWSTTATAEEDQAAFDALLQPLVTADAVPESTAVVRALRGVGVTDAQLQITSNRTPTGLDAGNVSVSVLQQGRCLVGEYHPGRFHSEVVDPVNGACLVGDTMTLPQ